MPNTFSYDNDLDTNIDLTPLIDTVFMLLIFFIMATSFSKPVLEVALQEAQGAAPQEKNNEPLTVTITKEGQILCNEEEVAAPDFDAFMATRLPEEGILFHVDKEADFGVFVQILDAAKKHGKENFAIVTAPAEQKAL